MLVRVLVTGSSAPRFYFYTRLGDEGAAAAAKSARGIERKGASCLIDNYRGAENCCELEFALARRAISIDIRDVRCPVGRSWAQG